MYYLRCSEIGLKPFRFSSPDIWSIHSRQPPHKEHGSIRIISQLMATRTIELYNQQLARLAITKSAGSNFNRMAAFSIRQMRVYWLAVLDMSVNRCNKEQPCWQSGMTWLSVPWTVI